MGPGIPKGTLSAGTEAPSSGPGQHAGCERRPTLERVSRGLTYRGRGRRTPARPTGRRAEPECGGARVEPSRADGPEVGALRFLPGARREGSAPAAAVCACASGRAPGGPTGRRRVSESLSRTGSAARARPGRRPRPSPAPSRPRRRAGVVSRAGLGRGRVSAGRGAAGDFRGARPPLPRLSLVRRQPLCGAALFLEPVRRSSQVEQHCLFISLSGFWLLGEN